MSASLGSAGLRAPSSPFQPHIRGSAVILLPRAALLAQSLCVHRAPSLSGGLPQGPWIPFGGKPVTQRVSIDLVKILLL